MLASLASVLRNIRTRTLLFTLPLALCNACGGGASNGPPLAPIAAFVGATPGPTPSPTLGVLNVSQSSLSLLPATQAGVTVQTTAGANIQSSSSDSNVAVVTVGANGSYVIHGIAPGTATISFTATGSAPVTVLVTVASPIVVSSPSIAIAGSGSTATFSVSEIGYVGSYTILSNSASSVVSVAQTTSGHFTLNAISPGTATVLIGDANGQQASVAISVSIALVVSPSSLALSGIGNTRTFSASENGYTGAFTIVSNTNAAAATVMQSTPGTFTVTAVGSGTTNITIRDSGNVRQTISVGVTVTHITISGSRQQ